MWASVIITGSCSGRSHILLQYYSVSCLDTSAWWFRLHISQSQPRSLAFGLCNVFNVCLDWVTPLVLGPFRTALAVVINQFSASSLIWTAEVALLVSQQFILMRYWTFSTGTSNSSAMLLMFFSFLLIFTVFAVLTELWWMKCHKMFSNWSRLQTFLQVSLLTALSTAGFTTYIYIFYFGCLV